MLLLEFSDSLGSGPGPPSLVLIGRRLAPCLELVLELPKL